MSGIRTVLTGREIRLMHDAGFDALPGAGFSAGARIPERAH